VYLFEAISRLKVNFQKTEVLMVSPDDS
jgi:hypothetical protein